MNAAERNALVEKHLPTIRSVAKGIAARGIPTYIELDDLIQDAAMRLLDSLAQYEGRGGATLKTFVRHTVRNDIMDAIRAERAKRNGEHKSSLDQLRPQKRRFNMRDAKKILTARQWDAMLYTYGLGFTQLEAARVMGCTQQTIFDLLSTAYKNLKSLPVK